MSKYYLYFISCLLMFCTEVSYSQLTVASASNSGDFHVCTGTQTLNVVLSATGTVTGDSITFSLERGIRYVPGTVAIVTASTAITITESNISNLQSPSFTFSGTMNAGDSCIFSITRSADCRASRSLSYLDYVYVYYNNNNSTSVYLEYSLKFGLVELSGSGANGNIASLQGNRGDILTRDIFISNGGFGCVKVIDFYTIDAGAGVRINQIAVTGVTGASGTNPLGSPVIVTPDRINGDTSFYILDVEQLNVIDTQLCNGDRITIEETVEVIGCFSDLEEGETQYGAYWECDSICQNISVMTANVSNPPGKPDLLFTDVSTNNKPDCFDGQVFTKTFRVENIGTENALNVKFAFEVKARGASATLLLPNTSTMTSSTAGPTPIVASPFEPKKASYSIDSIPAGTYIEIQIDVEHPCPTTCGLYHYDGYRIKDVDYESICGETYNTGSRSISHYKTFEADNTLENNFPVIGAGQNRKFTSTVTAIRGLSTTSTLFWEITIPPCGVVFNNALGDIDWGGMTPNSVTISGNVITAAFSVATTNDFNNVPFNIDLTGICGMCGTSQSIRKRLLVNPCSSNTGHCQICLYEVTEPLGIEACTVGGPCLGAAVDGFQFVRTNLGLPDNNNDRFLDASGILDLNAIDRSRFIVFDTAQATINATISIDTGSPVLNHAYGQFTIDDNWNFLDASIEVFDASTGASFICTGATASSTLSGSGTKRTYIIDISPNTLGATCANMSSFVFEDGDSLVLRANLVNLRNGTSIFNGIVYPIDFYVSEVANPVGTERLSCGSNAYSEIYNIFNLNSGLDIAISGGAGSCGEKQIDLEFEAKTGVNIQNANIFPYEWRPIAYPDTVRMIMPTGYIYKSAVLSNFLGVSNTLAIEPLDPNADTLVFAVGQLYQPGGIPSDTVQARIPDGIERSEVQVLIQATCETPANVNEPITMMMDAFHPLPQLQALELLDDTLTETILSWNKPDISITNVSNATAEGVGRAFEWTIRVNNTRANSDAENVFLSANLPPGQLTDMTIEHIDSNGTGTGLRTLTKVNNIWEFGTVNRNDFHDFKITAKYNGCDPDSLFIVAGFDCTAYPTQLSAYNNSCELDSIVLYRDPKYATLQFHSDQINSLDNICDTLVYSFTLNSATLANLMNPRVAFQFPLGLELVGSAMIEYPLNTAPRPFTMLDLYPSNGFKTIYLDSANAENPGVPYLDMLENGLLGTRETIDANERQAKITFNFRTTCDFTSGTYFNIEVEGESPCGDAARGKKIGWSPDIYVSGLNPSYSVVTAMELLAGSGSPTCEDTIHHLQIELIPSAASTNRDTGYYDLPEHIEYAGNFVCLEADPSICPRFVEVIDYLSGNSRVVLQYPDTWNLGDTINFSFDVNVAGATECSDHSIVARHTTTEAARICNTTGLLCSDDIMVITGHENLDFIIAQPNFDITNVTVVTNTATSGQSYEVGFDITNNGIDASAGLIVEFYCADSLGNPIGLPVHTHSITVPIPTNQTIRQNLRFTTPMPCNNVSGMLISISKRPHNADAQCMCKDVQKLITDIITNFDLPVDWLYFNAKKVENNKALLSWGTATETNSLGFEIEHAKPTNGLPVFDVIGFVDAKGTPATGANYNYNVKNLAPGVHYFRLRQIDTDGSVEYSEIRAVVITGLGSESEFKIYPTLINPNNQVLYLYSPTEGPIVVEIFSMLGQESTVLYSGNVAENSLNELSLSTRGFSSGHYVVRVRTDQTIFTQQISIIR